MASVTQGIGAGAREAIEKVSGDQLRGLSSTLDNLSTQLGQIGTAVNSSGDEAAQKIRLAGEDFATAAQDIREAFAGLTTQVDTMGKDMSSRGEAANAAQKEALEKILGSIDEAQMKSVSMVSDILEALKNGGIETADRMRQEVGNTLKAGVEASQKTLRIAIEESGQAIKDTAASLSRAVGDAATQVERAAVGLSRTGDGAERTADAIRSVTDNARLVASVFGEASTGFSQAAAPVAEAARLVNQATTQLTKTITEDRAAGVQTINEMKELAQDVRATHSAAAGAWQDYRARFEGVDRSLAEATDKLAQTLADSLTQFRDFAQKVDREMASAVSRLGNTMTQIEEYAESLDEFIEHSRSSKEPAE